MAFNKFKEKNKKAFLLLTEYLKKITQFNFQ